MESVFGGNSNVGSNPTLSATFSCRGCWLAMNVRFYVDPTTGQPHIYKHSVNEAEVEDVLQAPGEDRPGGEGSRIAIGQAGSGRYLRIVYVPDPEPHGVFVITAYELKGKPLIAYRRRRRRRQV